MVLEVSRAHLNPLFPVLNSLTLLQDLDSLHLMEGRVMGGVDLITAVHVSGTEELGDALLEKLCLVRAGVSAEEFLFGDVVRVREAPRLVVLGDKKVIKALLRRHDGVQRVLGLELRVTVCEILLDLGLDDVEGVVLLQVKVPSHQVGDVRRDIVFVGVLDQLLGPIHLGGRRHQQSQPIPVASRHSKLPRRERKSTSRGLLQRRSGHARRKAERGRKSESMSRRSERDADESTRSPGRTVHRAKSTLKKSGRESERRRTPSTIRGPKGVQGQ
mmetsp:Transcript_30806/g.72820  ORF Transcript_30806/g.72820 Transcript_30806/m.72820 type:complete len:273 (-) Transcript_30806:29-847(-)